MPISGSFSMINVDTPLLAAYFAAIQPEGPAPTTTTSYISFIFEEVYNQDVVSVQRKHEMKEAKKITIKGKVHDVGYRLFLLTEAESLLIDYFDARNALVNGEQQLIVLVRGPRDKINSFVDFIRSNYPPEASVHDVVVEEYTEEVRSIDSFRQSFMVSQLAKMVQIGLVMLNKQDQMLDKQDQMLKKQDQMLDKQDMMMNVLREESEKVRNVIKERFEEDVKWLKSEILEIKMTLNKIKEKVGIV
ncbi:MAG: acylphosphatase [Candidatus Methanophagaceae archaeon]|nr:MAG: acylphosphatase [Methanophagales archaeon]